MKSLVEIVNEAGRILLDPSRRARRSYAQDSNGTYVDATDPGACKFCFVGALRKAAGKRLWDYQPLYARDLISVFTGEHKPGAVDWWDRATEEEQTACAQRMIEYKG
jgi:hypothetical protein